MLPVYLRVLLGEEWIRRELEKELATRHPILQWHHAMIAYQKAVIQTQEVQTVPATGAISALLGLSYNLYLMAHNSELQEKLIKRLKDRNQFLGAHYETQVAAFCIQAGFEITLEDEDDPSSTHCEFTAANIKSGRKFSVEAKARTHGKKSGAISSQLYSALKKSAEYERIIFININTSEKITNFESTKWMHEAIASIRGAETRLKIKGADAPPAYVLLTNQKNAYNLNDIGFDIGAVAESFKIPDFRIDYSFASLREAIDSRDRHKEVSDIFEAIKRHHKIPSTFDGEIPEFAFGGLDNNMPRLIVGNQYLLPDENGKETIGTLLDPVVGVEKGKHFVTAIYELQDGRKVICRNELTEEEITAYKQHPDTFFGIYKQQNRTCNYPISFYDFMYESYRKSTKEKLLEFMKSYPNYEELTPMTQEELAKLYCEGVTHNAMNRGFFKIAGDYM